MIVEPATVPHEQPPSGVSDNGPERGDPVLQRHADFLDQLYTGLRKGEVLALRWQDVDLEDSVLHVQGTLKRVVGSGLVVDEPKTERSRRPVAIPTPAVDALRRHRATQAALRLAAGPMWHDSGHVLTTPIGTPVDPRNLNRSFDAVLAAAGLPHRRFHDLRHSAATLMLELGTPLEVVSAALGHSSISITADIYAEVRLEAQRLAADRMGHLASGGTI